MENLISSIILTKYNRANDLQNSFRLIRTLDGFHNTDVFSIFLTTEFQNVREEEFVYDISRDADTAKEFFTLLCKENVSALHLREVAEDFISSHR